MSILFISDLHLEEKRRDIVDAFLNFLNTTARKRDALYILGDFFEAWIGDDENTDLQKEIKTALQALTQAGTALFFMHGNRDFLIGEQFAEETGGTLLPEGCVIDLYGRSTLLMHGDSLCIDDKEYQKFRTNMRNEQWQSLFLKRPLAERQLVAQQLRAISQAKNKGKAEYIMDVNADEVVRQMTDSGVNLLIHGHTHRPAIHEVEFDDKHLTRVVLGDWDKALWYLEAQSNGQIDLQSASLNI